MKPNKKHETLFRILLLAVLLILPACAKTIPDNALDGVDDAISFEALLKNPDLYHGRTVLLGGAIISTENLPGKTTLTILQQDLGSDHKPLNNDQSKGRFILTTPEFLDPAIYAKGRRITTVGTVKGREIRPLDSMPYAHPVIQKDQLYIWPDEKDLDSEPRIYFGIGIGIGNYGYR